MALKTPVIKASYFAYWSDLWGFPLAFRLVSVIRNIDWITPNLITFFSFGLTLVGSVALIAQPPLNQLIPAILLPVSFILDDADGQLARLKNLSSPLGDFLDKILDTLKIYVISFFLAYAGYSHSHQIIYLLLGFTACFFYSFRQYLKYAAMFNAMDLFPHYFEKSARVKSELEKKYGLLHKKLRMTFFGYMKSLWIKHRLIFCVDESEFAIFVAVGALFSQLGLVLWILAVSQLLISFWRIIERSFQISTRSNDLYKPLRK